MDYTDEFIRRFWNKVDKRTDDECWPWMASLAGRGYGQLRIPGTRKNTYSHRVAYELAYGPLPEGMFACHRCDNPKCCNPKHLFAGTAKVNQQDMAAKKRSMWGERNGMATHSSQYIDGIFRLRARGLSQNEIGILLGVSQQYVGKVLRGERWGQYDPPTEYKEKADAVGQAAREKWKLQGPRKRTTDEQVKEVFVLREQGKSQAEIGKLLGMSQVNVGRILRGERRARVFRQSNQET